MQRKRLQFRRDNCPAPTYAGLQEWYRTALGRALEAAELESLAAMLPTLFGYHLLLVAPPWQGNALDTSRVRHQVVQCPAYPQQEVPGLLASSEAWPYASDSLDVIILPHILEFAERPHQVLREAERSLIPEGHLVLLGFNPWSLWGSYGMLAGWRDRLPWCGRFLGVGRLRDWLALLGFDTLDVQPLFYRPPINHSGTLRRLAFLEGLADGGRVPGAAVFLLLARKRVIGMTPIRPRWRPRRGLLSPGVIEPTRRTSYARDGQRRAR